MFSVKPSADYPYIDLVYSGYHKIVYYVRYLVSGVAGLMASEFTLIKLSILPIFFNSLSLKRMRENAEAFSAK